MKVIIQINGKDVEIALTTEQSIKVLLIPYVNKLYTFVEAVEVLQHLIQSLSDPMGVMAVRVDTLGTYREKIHTFCIRKGYVFPLVFTNGEDFSISPQDIQGYYVIKENYEFLEELRKDK